MGLDMYAMAYEPGSFIVNEDETIKSKPGFQPVEIFYWRKFNALHGWMEQLWRDRGGEGEFNCVAVPLSFADLERLREDAQRGRLQPVGGFFFGPMTLDPYDLASVQEFIDVAWERMEDGFIVAYNSWW